MARIHHATAKFAASKGLQITEKGDKFEVSTRGGSVLSLDVSAKDAVAFAVKEVEEMMEEMECDFEEAMTAIDESRVDESAEEDDDEEGEETGKSIVKRKYKTAYKPFRNTCGDDFTELMAKAIKYSVKLDGKTVKRVDVEKLTKLAKMNGVWDPSYADLNVGQFRMAVGNRMRAMMKKGTEIKWI